MIRAGVICEFNPFHNGHKFLLEQIKSVYADETVCIMSGSFVQRGDIAVTDKYARTRAALQSRADLVVELPTVYAMSNAASFAENGVRIAKALHCDKLCFGSEDPLDQLNFLADLLSKDETNRKISEGMKRGLYYPKALSQAVGSPYAAIMEKPNNILALEYIKACRKYGLTPIAIPRHGVDHDAPHISGEIASASKIREMMALGKDYRPYTPMTVEKPCLLSSLAPAIVYRLKTVTAEELARTADVSEGLENRIIEAAKQYNSPEEILEAIKTKRYTMARLRRILLSAFLNISAEMQRSPVPYLRVLGVRNGMEHIISNTALPLIVKVRTDYEALDDSAKEIFNVDIRAAEALNIAKGAEPVNEFSAGLIKIG